MKETKKQVKAQIINDLSKKYKEKLKKLEDRYVSLDKFNDEVYSKYKTLEKENIKLKLEIKHLNEIINEITEIIKLPEDTKEQAKIEWIKQKTIKEQEMKFLNSPVFKIYKNLINSL